MTSTKIMCLGILIMLLGLAFASATTQTLWFRTIGPDTTTTLSYIASAIFVVGFIVGLIGLFKRS